MGVLKIMSHEGDSRISWNPSIDKEVEIAKDKFDELLKKGFAAFRIDDKGKRTARKVKEFLPFAGTLLLVAPLQGG